MKIYKDYAHASISMVEDEAFVKALPHHNVIIETGTHLGTGSTRMLAKTSPKRLITIEANADNYRGAVRNLAEFPFVEPHWGLTVDRKQAIDFIRANTDYNIEGIFVDDPDPVSFYTREVMVDCPSEGLLARFLEEIKNQNPLILLDSAGGIGYLEYVIVRKIMGSKPHALILDDTHHVKHYRSRMEAIKVYDILYDDPVHGRCVLTKKPRG